MLDLMDKMHLVRTLLRILRTRSCNPCYACVQAIKEFEIILFKQIVWKRTYGMVTCL